MKSKQPKTISAASSASRDWRQRWDTLNDEQQRLTLAFGVSLLLHALLLTLRFVAPQVLDFSKVETSMEVVLVNDSTPNEAVQADVLAQVSSEGGGTQDFGRATSPFVASMRVADGDDVVHATRKVQQLEAAQRKLMAIAHDRQAIAVDESKTNQKQSDQAGMKDEDRQLIQRMQAQIEKQINDYNKRPKRMTFGVNARGVAYARYVESWREQIEKLGTRMYPDAARGRIYGELIATTEIGRDGQLVSFRIDRSSGQPMLDKAAEQTVRMGAPFAPFTADMAAESDILQITRTFTFTNNALQTRSTTP